MNNINNSRNKKGNVHGYWEVYWDCELWYKCFFIDGELIGYDECYKKISSPKKISIKFHL